MMYQLVRTNTSSKKVSVEIPKRESDKIRAIEKHASKFQNLLRKKYAFDVVVNSRFQVWEEFMNIFYCH